LANPLICMADATVIEYDADKGRYWNPVHKNHGAISWDHIGNPAASIFSCNSLERFDPNWFGTMPLFFETIEPVPPFAQFREGGSEVDRLDRVG
jgi:hypothetical protein